MAKSKLTKDVETWAMANGYQKNRCQKHGQTLSVMGRCQRCWEEIDRAAKAEVDRLEEMRKFGPAPMAMHIREVSTGRIFTFTTGPRRRR